MLEGKGIPTDLKDDNDINIQLDIFMKKLVNLESLEYHNYFNKPFGNSLDKLVNLKYLSFIELPDEDESSYNLQQPLNNSLDKLVNLESLINVPNIQLGNSLDKLVNLKKLSFSDKFHQPFNDSLEKLVSLESLINVPNEPLGNSLDKLVNLKNLSFGDYFNQTLGNSLDKLVNLENLKFGKDYNQLPNNLPLNKLSSLKIIVFDPDYEYINDYDYLKKKNIRIYLPWDNGYIGDSYNKKIWT